MKKVSLVFPTQGKVDPRRTYKTNMWYMPLGILSIGTYLMHKHPDIEVRLSHEDISPYKGEGLLDSDIVFPGSTVTRTLLLATGEL